MLLPNRDSLEGVCISLAMNRAKNDDAHLGNISWLATAITNLRQIPLDRHGDDLFLTIHVQMKGSKGFRP